MKRGIVILLALLLASVAGVRAQQTAGPPDYRIDNTRSAISTDGQEVVITFSVTNSGGPASTAATLAILNLADNAVMVTERLDPLGSGASVDRIELRFNIAEAELEAGSDYTFVVTVSSNEEDARTATDNRSEVGLFIPGADGQTGTTTPNRPPGQSVDADDGNILKIPLIDKEIDLDNREELGILIAIGLLGFLILVVIYRILRLLFRRTPSFGNWQPPYATVPPMDPNSTYGRRQLWQQHAQNNALPVPCQEGTIYPRKVLLGMDGEYLSGWKIKALRMTQYDMYGRVSRSQVLANGGQINRLNRVARKSSELDAKKARRRIMPVARSLARRFKKNVSKRSAMLPIAVDVRLQGTHGEVRIIFELYRCQNGQLQQLDSWEPEMTVIGRAISENYTFTVFGQTGGETVKDFRGRLVDDISRVLTSMMLSPVFANGSESEQQPATGRTPAAPTSPGMPAVNAESSTFD